MADKPAAAASESTNVISVIGGLIGQLLNQPGVRESLLQEALKALQRGFASLFNRNKPKPPVTPVLEPVPAPVQPDPNFPDDHIPRPPVATSTRKVSRVRLKLERVQLSRERFPKAYTDENPFGLVDAGDIQRGNAMNWGSKFWIDLTAYDQDGHEFLRPEVLAQDLSFNTVIQVGDAFIKGHGPEGQHSDKPKAGYETNDTDQIGTGITAWLSSLGFMQQFQAWPSADGKSFQVSGSVDGVAADNPFTLKVS